ncbi:MAG: hypothetical protein KC561_14675, partial [Myxococcales bacterium]|nr:hypothetical protein [Myxococcales bacterium]
MSKHPFFVLIGLAGIGIAACGDDPQPEPDPVPLSEQVAAAGIAEGDYQISGDNLVCRIANSRLPGSPQTYDDHYLTGLNSFSVDVSDSRDIIIIEGEYDRLSVTLSDGCLVYSSGDPLENHTSCQDASDPCTPYQTVRLCAGSGD